MRAGIRDPGSGIRDPGSGIRTDDHGDVVGRRPRTVEVELVLPAVDGGRQALSEFAWTWTWTWTWTSTSTWAEGRRPFGDCASRVATSHQGTASVQRVPGTNPRTNECGAA